MLIEAWKSFLVGYLVIYRVFGQDRDLEGGFWAYSEDY